MSYWNQHPEKLEEVTIEYLPIIWRVRVEEGGLCLYDVPEDIVGKAMIEGTEDYFAIMADYMEEDR